MSKRLTLLIFQQIFDESKDSFLFAKYGKDEHGNIKILSFHTKWNGGDYFIESIGDSNYQEMVEIYKLMALVDEETAKEAIWYRKIKESPIKQKSR